MIFFLTVTFKNQLSGRRDRHINNITVKHSVLSVLKEVLKTQREERLPIQEVGRLCREEEVGEIFYQVILQQIVQAKRKPKKKNDLFSLLYFKEGENEAREVG